jgi:hypothetical protein
VEGKRLGIELDDMTASVAEHWMRLGGEGEASGRGGRGKR